jgi:uncharacterized protein (UPF0261 family)
VAGFLRVHAEEEVKWTTSEEHAELGRIVAGKLNAAIGPTTLALPLGGVSLLDVEGEAVFHPDADAALFDALRDHLDDDVDIVELDVPINDAAFAEAMVERPDDHVCAADVAPAE